MAARWSDAADALAFGMKFMVDDSLPPGTAKIIGPSGEVSWIVGIDMAKEEAKPRWIKRHVRLDELVRSPAPRGLSADDMHEAARLIASKRLEKAEAKREIAQARAVDPLEELARLKDGTPQHFGSPHRQLLLDRYLIERTYRENGLWSGDRITEKGLRALRRGSID